MPSPESRPPHWGTVWLEARAAGGNPQSALVAAGLCTAAEVAASEPAGRSRPPPAERPRRRLKSHEGLDPEHYAPVEAELSARSSPSPGPTIVAVPARRPRPRRRRWPGPPARRAAG